MSPERKDRSASQCLTRPPGEGKAEVQAKTEPCQNGNPQGQPGHGKAKTQVGAHPTRRRNPQGWKPRGATLKPGEGKNKTARQRWFRHLMKGKASRGGTE